jgi:glycosyltransferase involved in cell wall biosynthesis
MKILLIAFSCNPEQGSESMVGWKATKILSQKHKVWVLTHVCNQEAITRAQKKGDISEDVEFVFAGEIFKWHPNRMLARLQSWKLYREWLDTVPKLLKTDLRQEAFDLLHHVTVATWRLAPLLTRQPIPLVWGPMGGSASYPWSLLGMTSLSGAIFEVSRNILNIVCARTSRFREICRNAAAIICVNRETKDLVHRTSGRDSGLFILNASTFSRTEVEEYRQLLKKKDYHGDLKAFVGGICIGSKGIYFALRALRLARDRGHIIYYTVASTGPELGFLKKKAKELDLSSQVTFHEGFRGDEYREALRAHQIYLMPSFREGSSISIMESMLAGGVPIVVRASTPGEIVTPECGFAVPVTHSKKIVEGLAQALIQLTENRELLKRFSHNAHERIAEGFTAERYLETINHIYRQATDRN